MSTEAAFLKQHLEYLANGWASLQANIAAKQQEIQQIGQRRAKLNEEIVRTQGALAYNQVLAESATNRLAELEKAAIKEA